jgi:hypothetical protein
LSRYKSKSGWFYKYPQIIRRRQGLGKPKTYEEIKDQDLYTIAEYTGYGKPEWVDLGHGQRAFIAGEAQSLYTEEELQQILDNLRESIRLMKKASPEFHDVFVDDIRRIGILAPEYPSQRKIFRRRHEPLTFASKSTKDRDLIFVNADVLLNFLPEYISGTLGHEEFHALAAHLGRDTKEEEALAFKTEDVILRKLHQHGLSDSKIRSIIEKYYKDYPSILLP